MRIDNPSISGSLSFIGGTNSISATSVSLTGSLSGTFEGAFSGDSLTNISGAFNSVSESLALDITANASSINSLNAASSSYLLNTTDTLDGDLTVTGKITAQEFYTEFVSASIIYESGSTKFGNSADDTHVFTGDVGVGTDDPYSDPGYTSVNVGGTNGGQFIISSGSGGSGGRYLQIAANSAGSDIQTIPDIPLRFLTSTTEKMRIQGNGNVGIGTDAPNHLLQVDGPSTAFGETSMRMYINRTGTNVASLIFTTGGGSVANGWAEIGQTDADGDLYFKANASAAGYNTRMVIKGNSGYIGIGTTAPNAPLDLYRVNTDADATGGGVIFSRYEVGGSFRASSIFHRFITDSGDSMVFTVSDSSNPYIADTTALDGRVKMVINTLGNVGIGTTTPDKKLLIRQDENGSPTILKLENRDGNINTGAFIGFSTGYAGWAAIGAKREGAENDSSLIFSPMLNESAVERMRITSTGGVGINTTALVGKLTVSNNAAGVSTSAAASFVNDSSTGVNIMPSLDTSNYNSIIASGDSAILGNGQYSPIVIGSHDGSAIRISRYNIEFGANNGLKATLNSNGNLGIGNNSPSQKLHVNGIGEFAGAIRITETGTAQSILIGNQDSDGTNTPSIIQGVNGALRFGRGNSWVGEGGTFTEVFKIESNGVSYFQNNLGVGITSPGSSRLHVDGGDQYAIRVNHNKANASNSYDDALFLANINQNDSNYVSIGLSTNGADGQHHRAQIRAYRNTGYTYGGDLAFNIRVNNGDWSERVRFTSDGMVRHNKVDTMTWTGIIQGLTGFDLYLFTGDEGGGGNVFKVEAGFAHYFGMSYNCIAEFWVTTRGTSASVSDVYRYDSANAGSWTASKSSADTLKITKTAGTYAGGGRYWVKVTKVNYNA